GRGEVWAQQPDTQPEQEASGGQREYETGAAGAYDWLERAHYISLERSGSLRFLSSMRSITWSTSSAGWWPKMMPVRARLAALSTRSTSSVMPPEPSKTPMGLRSSMAIVSSLRVPMRPPTMITASAERMR